MAERRASTAVKCPKCDIKISRSADLGRHMKTHLSNKEELMHHCSHPGCEYKALQESNLRTHLNTHSGERPHKCTYEGCEFDTADPGSLTRHRERVHGILPKANSRRPSNVARKEARRQRRMTPYSSSSASSGSSSRPWSTSPTPPLPELPCGFDQFQLSPSTTATGKTNAKNKFAAYDTDLIHKFPTVNNPLVPSDAMIDWGVLDRHFENLYHEFVLDGEETTATPAQRVTATSHPIHTSLPSNDGILCGVNDPRLSEPLPAAVHDTSAYEGPAYTQAGQISYCLPPMRMGNVWMPMQEHFQF